ncbi:MAG: class I SAM-dependent methyltransferase [Candidatus Methanoplasma sp.]|jgi:demethylmenaquinone methyltransferase/2-methoxy-6-polyprenyl-1,4-benzoquinol methylase|nr:class I SAM-dependent methyltransferase [Candidatus Methanoplasma sp.]
MDHREHGRMEREFFNRLADSWDENYANDVPKAGYVVSLMNLDGGEKIMDVGTGTGVMIQFYEDALDTGSVLAIDLSDKMVARATAKYPPSEHPNVRFEVADVYDVIPRGDYDAVVCNSCLPHFHDKSGAVRLLSKCLKSGGKMVVSHSCSREAINHVHMHHHAVIRHDIVPTMEEMEEMFRAAGITPTFRRSDEECHIIIGTKD